MLTRHLVFVCWVWLCRTSCAQQNCESDDPSYENQYPITSSLDFYWTVDQAEGNIKIRVAYTDGGSPWVSVGWSPNGAMVPSEVVVGLPNDQTVLKYSIEGYPLSGTVLMDSQTLTDTAIDSSTGQTDISFTKPLQEPGEIEIVPNSENVMIWAIGFSGSLGMHAEAGSFTINLQTCEFIAGDALVGLSTPIIEAHGWLFIVAWMYLVPISVLTAVFKRNTGANWLLLHQVLQVLALSLMVVGISLIVNERYVTGRDHMDMSSTRYGIHSILGIESLVLVLLGFSSGLFNPGPPTDKGPGVAGVAFSVIHPGFGHLSVALAIFTILSGIDHAYSRALIGSKDPYLIATFVPFGLFLLGPLAQVLSAVFGKKRKVTITGGLIFIYLGAVLLVVAMTGEETAE